MSSDSGSDSESNGSTSHNQGTAPTPGHGLDRSPSNSPDYNKSGEPSREGSVNRHSRSRSRSRSVASQRSGSPSHGKSHRSVSADSARSASGQSKRSSSAGSQRSGSAASRQSGYLSPNRSRSGSPASKRSRGSYRSGSQISGSNRSRSSSAASKHSRAGSELSNRSRSKSPGSGRSRSGSAVSTRSRSGSRRSRSGSGSRRSRSGSAGSRRSGSADSRRSGSNKSGERSANRSGSNSPNLQIDEQDELEEEKAGEKEKKKSKALISDSDEDGGGGGTERVDAADIFGDADDISSEEEKEEEKAGSEQDTFRRSRSRSRSRSEDKGEQRPILEDDEGKENEPEPIPETRIDVEVPKISCDLGRDINFVKLPNFLSVETRPFDPETYEDEIDEEETLDEEGRARLKLKVENTIRWRDVVDDEGNIKKESNARFVKWSDGSYSLHLGSEIFDVYKQPLQGDHNHLFIRQGTGLQGQAVFRTKLSFRPHSTESFTHRKMTLSLADRSTKNHGIKIMSQVGVDPDLDKASRIKKEEEKLRQVLAKPKTTRKKTDGGTRLHATSFSREEEASDDEGAISLNAIKNKYKSGAAQKGGAIYSSDEEGSDIESTRNRKHGKPSALKESDEESESD